MFYHLPYISPFCSYNVISSFPKHFTCHSNSSLVLLINNHATAIKTNHREGFAFNNYHDYVIHAILCFKQDFAFPNDL